jgi:signal transduction histidine kinase
MVEDISKRRQAEEKVRNYQKQLQSLALELSLTEERERRRLATELHDHIGQELAISKIKLGLLQKTTASREVAAQLREVYELIELMIKDTRSLTFKLGLPVLYELGFGAAVEWLAKDMHKEHGIHYQLEGNGLPSTMSKDMSFLLFQMVRELLFNVVKHARATMVKIAIENVNHRLQVVVADNGVGFDPAQNDPQKDKISGFGLFSIRERLNYFKGDLEVESEPGHGTRVTMTIPMNDNKTRKCKNLPASTTPAELGGAN